MKRKSVLFHALALILALALALGFVACAPASAPAPGNNALSSAPNDMPDDTPAGDDSGTTGAAPSSAPPPTPVSPNERGNSPSNIANGGSAALKDDWIYFSDIDRALRKIRADGSEETTLVEDGCLGGINVVGDWIYYRGNTEEGSGPLALFKIRTDGTDEQMVA